ncbi:MAG TPA: hypothetical protein V6D26_05725 [Stenomitos sp.]
MRTCTLMNNEPRVPQLAGTLAQIGQPVIQSSRVGKRDRSATNRIGNSKRQNEIY